MEGEGLFGKEKVSTHGIQRTSKYAARRRGQESINTSLSLSSAQIFSSTVPIHFWPPLSASLFLNMPLKTCCVSSTYEQVIHGT